MNRLLFLGLLLTISGCASTPRNAPECSGDWRSLNPAYYDAAQKPQESRDAGAG